MRLVACLRTDFDMEIQHSQLKLNHLSDTPSTKADGAVPSTKAVGGRIFSGVFNKDVKVPLQEAELVGTSSSNIWYSKYIVVCTTKTYFPPEPKTDTTAQLEKRFLQPTRSKCIRSSICLSVCLSVRTKRVK